MSLSAIIMMIFSLVLVLGGITVCSVFALLHKTETEKAMTVSETEKHE